ncbi:MAG: phytoene desaturase family protein [Candidatus Cyclobacteriaceae bacterium M3_2C_046]
MAPNKKVVVIGSGFASLSAATNLADQGFQVEIIEKNSSPGGRARKFTEAGFTFDMGPSWYWMPDVFESYFSRFGKSPNDYYDLVRLNPSYRVYFDRGDYQDMPADFQELMVLFENLEKGSGEKLSAFIKQAAYKYAVGINQLVYKPGRSIREFMSVKLLLDMIRMDLFTSFSKHIRKFFHHEKLIKLIEFPILFLGATPENTPALYSFMNYADLGLGTWYPMGGMNKIIAGMVDLAREKGVNFNYNQPIRKFEIDQGQITQVHSDGQTWPADIVVSGADYHHVETQLLPAEYQSYSQQYWDKRVMAPSSLIFYLGINKKLGNLLHHNLFFDEDFTIHAQEIYEKPQWPTKPLFYTCMTSKTDPSVAPEGMENIFILMPVAPGLKDDASLREKYYDIIMDRLEKHTGQSIRDSIIYKRSYAHQDFVQDYNAFKGNAYGLANTLRQTAILKPSLKSKKIDNLYYTGQLTVPGPGVPPSLISGIVVAEEIKKELNTH